VTVISIQLRARQMVILHKKEGQKKYKKKQSSYQAHIPRAVRQEKIKGEGEELVAAFY